MNKIHQKVFPTGKTAGFTLIELLIVVLIIGILAAVALPQYTLSVEKSRASEVLLHLKAIEQAGDLCYIANPVPEGVSGCQFNEIDINIPGLVKDVEWAETDNFEYYCDEGSCRNPYAHRKNSEYDYFIKFRDYFEGSLKPIVCYGDNEKGQRLCKALGGRELERDGARIIYEL